MAQRMQLAFYSSNFCEPCIQTRLVLDQISRLVPTATVVEHNIAYDESAAEQARIRSTPTVLVLAEDGEEVFRAEGVPTLNQVLVALAKAVT